LRGIIYTSENKDQSFKIFVKSAVVSFSNVPKC